MDLNEHALTEAQRSLKRLGITHLWRSPIVDQHPIEHATTELSSLSHDAQNSGPCHSPDATMPPLLRALFHGKQLPVRTLWTYAGLNADLNQALIPERFAVFRKIQESVCLHLNWPEKDICSWPLDIEQNLYHQGLQRFCPKIVICFGENHALLTSAERSEGGRFCLGKCSIFMLPSLDEMALGNKDLKNEAWKILRSIPV